MRKIILAASVAVAGAAIVTGAASATQTDPPAPSDSAAFPGGGTVSVLGVDYPKGTVVPALGSPESGPAAEQTQKATVDSVPIDNGAVTLAPTQQEGQTTPSDSAAFPGGGTVSVPGVNYPKGTAVPGVGTPASGPATLGYRPSAAETQQATVDSSSSGGTARQQASPAQSSDSAAFPGGGTVAVHGVNYPKGTSVPDLGTPESGPTVAHVIVDYAAPPPSGGGFDWGDAGVGLAIGLGAVGIIALLVIGIRKNTATPITV